MKITRISAWTVPVRSPMRNALVSFAELTATLVRVEVDVGGPKVAVGLGFGSIGRYAATAIVMERLAPRLLAAQPEEYADGNGRLDPVRAHAAMLRNEKPGGHGERSTAAGALDMALWDFAAKFAGVPLWRLLSDRFNGGNTDAAIEVYAAGGYYHDGDGRGALREELRGYLDAGYTAVKMKIGGAPLEADLRRIEAAVEAVGDAERVAVDANGRFDLATARAYATELDRMGIRWFEEAGDPLDYALQARLSAEFPALAFATGENLFSHQDVRNLVRHAHLNPARDTLQMDPALSYGLPEYLRMLAVLRNAGWSPRRCVPHGGHQFSLHLAAGLQLGGNESYPGVFAPLGGFGDAARIVDGRIARPEEPGIGVETKSDLYRLFQSSVA